MPSRENASVSCYIGSLTTFSTSKNRSFTETLKAAALSPQGRQQVGWIGLLVTELREIVHNNVAVGVMFSVVTFKEGAGHSGRLGPVIWPSFPSQRVPSHCCPTCHLGQQVPPFLEAL